MRSPVAGDLQPIAGDPDNAGARRDPWWVWALISVCGLAVGAVVAMAVPPREAPSPVATGVAGAAPRSHGGLAEIRFQVPGAADPGAELITAGVTQITAVADLRGGDPGAPITAKWVWDGNGQEAPAVVRKTLQTGTRASATLSLPGNSVAFGPGVGEVEFYRSGERVARGSFVVCANAGEILAQADAAARPTVVESVATSRGVATDGSPKAPAEGFRPNERVYAVFRYRRAEPGTEFRVSWYVQGAEIRRAQARVIAESPEGWGHAWLGAGGAGLPAGEYEARVTYGTSARPLGKAVFRVLGPSGGSSPPSPS